MTDPRRPAHLPTAELIAAWPAPTVSKPLRVQVSGCLAGRPVGYDGSTYGRHVEAEELLAQANLEAFPFCPEQLAFGAPRSLCDIHGGDGHDVLHGRARVIASTGEDWTEPMIGAAREMLDHARRHQVRFALLMDISAACGSQVIYDGPRPDAPYRAGRGVCAALLVEHGIPVVSQRDLRTIDLIRRKLGMEVRPGPDRFDHHESDWYRSYFPPGPGSR